MQYFCTTLSIIYEVTFKQAGIYYIGNTQDHQGKHLEGHFNDIKIRNSESPDMFTTHFSPILKNTDNSKTTNVDF